MNNLQYDSLYKFIVSLAIALIIVPIMLISVFFKFDGLIISQSDFNELTDVSRDIVEDKQELYAFISEHRGILVCILVGFMLVGIALLIWGLFQWNKKIQAPINDKYMLENKRLEQEIGLNQEEKSQKAQNQTREIEKDNGSEDNNTEHHGTDTKEYLDIQNQVYDKLVTSLWKAYDVINGARIGTYEYDIVASGKNVLYQDYIFEIRYINKNVTSQWVNNSIVMLHRLGENYSTCTSRKPIQHLIVITETTNEANVKAMFDKLTLLKNDKIVILNKEDISKLSIEAEIVF